MQIMKWLSLASIVALIISCFYPWISIENKDIVVSGFHAESIGFGKPGWLHVIFSGIFIIFLLLNKIWSLRAAFFISAFNIAWAVRNFIVLSACGGGICPTKHWAFYAVLISPVLAVIFLLLINKQLPKSTENNSL
jgi:hypothetical protein